MPSYNLIDQPFIPCLSVDGKVEHLSLRQVFERAPKLRSISCPSPLQTAAVYRLLLAILHCVLDLRTPKAWHAVWSRRCLPTEHIDRYLGDQRDRFDLFNPKRPFYQSTGLVPFFGPVQKLFPERAAGNNDTLFDHTHENSGFAVDP